MAVPNLGDAIVHSLRAVNKELEDNVTNHSTILRNLRKKGSVKLATGGRVIDETLNYGINNSIQWYDGYDTFTPPTTGQEVLDFAEYSWKQLGGFIAISGREEKINSGEYKRIDFAKSRKDNLIANLQNTFAASVFSDGTAFAGKELTGLLAAVPDNPLVGTYGGINRASQSFWRSKVSAAVPTSAANIVSRMNDMQLSTIRGDDMVDLIVAGQTLYRYFQESMQSIQRITSAESANAGYPDLYHQGAVVAFDSYCSSNRMYFLNTKNLFLRTFDKAIFDVGDVRQVTNADYKVIPVFSMCNLTTNRAAAHGVLLAA